MTSVPVNLTHLQTALQSERLEEVKLTTVSTETNRLQMAFSFNLNQNLNVHSAIGSGLADKFKMVLERTWNQKLSGMCLYIPLAFYSFPKQALVFMCLQYKYLENTVGKRRNCS